MASRAWLRVTFVAAAAMTSAVCGAPTTPGPLTLTTATSPTTSSFVPAPAIDTDSPLALVTISPASGSEIAIDYGTEVTAQFQIRIAETLPEAKVWMDLVDETGTICASRTSDFFAITKDSSTQAIVRMGFVPSSWKCPLPGRVVEVRARVITIVPVDAGRIKIHTHVSSAWPVVYSTRRYPPPPPGPPSPTTISSLWWHSNVFGCGSCFPLWDEALIVECVAKAADGDAVNIAITINWDDGRIDARSHDFPAGATSSVNGALFTFGAINRGPNGTAARSAVAQCVVTNSRGHVVQQTIRAPQ
jgi:hypothetical protein